MNKSIIFSTASPDVKISHKIIIYAVKEKEELISGKELKVQRPASSKIQPITLLQFLVFVVYTFLKGQWRGVNAINLHYKGVRIGKYAIATALRAPDAYTNIFKYYLRFFSWLYVGILRINNFIFIKDDVAAVYANDPCYMNGVYCDLAVLYKKPLYHNTYPYTLTRFSGAKHNQLSDYFYVQPIALFDAIHVGKKKYTEILSDTTKISYMQSVKFVECNRNLDFDNIYAVVYAHSFTDAQQGCDGDSAFLSVYEWLLFTIKSLREKKIIIKAHPGFFRENYETNVIRWDRDIWNNLVRKIADNNKIQIVDWPMQNSQLLENLSKETILISHHGNALLEGGGLGIKCICSISSPWRKFDLFNQWRTRQEYYYLMMSPESLRRTDPSQIYRYMACLYGGHNSFDSNDAWNKLISNFCGVSTSEFSRAPSIINNLTEASVAEIAKKLSSKLGRIDLAE